ncbi:hypothetical protein [Pseudophaeobacter sp.]|uniref:hypothetical protein n=1 Tax=unclassified Pseudophaeobacter TaxID=2637024 RepID=UPI00261771AF|nr:hypothetical protein [Pseudophaeobacter sp.]
MRGRDRSKTPESSQEKGAKITFVAIALIFVSLVFVVLGGVLGAWVQSTLGLTFQRALGGQLGMCAGAIASLAIWKRFLRWAGVSIEPERQEHKR